MIASLRGRILWIAEDHCVLDVHGVGYQIFASSRTLATLPEVGGDVRLHTEMIVREDAILLYGFSDAIEQEWFRLLRVVQGVGTRMALGILSVLTPRELMLTLRASDKKNLMRASGVGARLAGRIITELRDRVEKMSLPQGGYGTAVGEQARAQEAGGDIQDDALLALEGLGFKRYEAAPVIGKILKENKEELSLDKVIQCALKALAR